MCLHRAFSFYSGLVYVCVWVRVFVCSTIQTVELAEKNLLWVRAGVHIGTDEWFRVPTGIAHSPVW